MALLKVMKRALIIGTPYSLVIGAIWFSSKIHFTGIIDREGERLLTGLEAVPLWIEKQGVLGFLGSASPHFLFPFLVVFIALIIYGLVYGRGSHP